MYFRRNLRIQRPTTTPMNPEVKQDQWVDTIITIMYSIKHLYLIIRFNIMLWLHVRILYIWLSHEMWLSITIYIYIPFPVNSGHAYWELGYSTRARYFNYAEYCEGFLPLYSCDDIPNEYWELSPLGTIWCSLWCMYVWIPCLLMYDIQCGVMLYDYI